ncbi:hypothetical protein ES708_01518 [subsurface metagenome]
MNGIFGGVFKNIFPWMRVGTGQFGDGTNNLTIADGIVSLAGTKKRNLQLRPQIDVIAQIAASKPTQVTRGISRGFSMPIWDSGGNVNEELFLYSIVPRRWDAVSDLEVCMGVAISGAEDVGDKFKFQLSWDCVNCGEVLGETSVDVEVETTILIGRSAAWNVYRVDFTIDYDATGHIVTPECLLS